MTYVILKKCSESIKILNEYNFHYSDSLFYPGCIYVYSHILTLYNIMNKEDFCKLMEYRVGGTTEYEDCW